MNREESKFLDLDMVLQQIQNEEDRSLFTEALTCYHVGSHRAAVILAWIATVNCLRRRIEEIAAEGDGTAQKALEALETVEGQSPYEQTLIDQGRKCELYDENECKSLSFARDQRSQCAHATGYIPSAEAVRYILFVCSQYVLCRRGYRGIAYIRETVTSRFDDPYFLPTDPDSIRMKCQAIASRVPGRLRPQFAKLAVQERPTEHSEIWRKNAIGFFREILANKDDTNTRGMADGLQGFETSAPELFAVLIGLHVHIPDFFEEEQREQAHRRLTRELLDGKPTRDEVIAWTNLGASDGFSEEDILILQNRFAVVASLIAQNNELLENMAQQIVESVYSKLKPDILPDSAVEGIQRLFISRLFSEESEITREVVNEIIGRYAYSDNHRQLLDGLQTWNDSLLVAFLELSAEFLETCDEDRPDDVILLFEAARELANRNPLLIPAKFSDTVIRALSGEMQPEWRSLDSEMGNNIRSQADLLSTQYGVAFEQLAEEVVPLLVSIYNGEDPQLD